MSATWSTTERRTKGAVLGPMLANRAALFLAFGLLLLVAFVDPTLILTTVLAAVLWRGTRGTMADPTRRVIGWVALVGPALWAFLILQCVRDPEFHFPHALGGLCRWVAFAGTLWATVRLVRDRHQATAGDRYESAAIEAWIDATTQTLTVRTGARVVTGPLGAWAIDAHRDTHHVGGEEREAERRHDLWNLDGSITRYITPSHTRMRWVTMRDSYVTYDLHVLDPRLYAGRDDWTALRVPGRSIRVEVDPRTDGLFAQWLERQRSRIAFDPRAARARWEQATTQALDVPRALAGRPKGGKESVVWSPTNRTTLMSYALIHAPTGRVYVYQGGAGTWMDADRFRFPPDHLHELPAQEATLLRAELIKAQQARAKQAARA
ncbi:hypothetical protein [Dyella psychrodurans]|uniref:Uncharacterized protein n=1 Tax=Dyella psychrodurans TaxID=1927960 RepID=A0A370XC45_9GAMM|nr:hypothetical protein [Dyella psychrodurans]RDS85872.1 hypothetical protein DWU99_00940 [Dyella psychrodurans]